MTPHMNRPAQGMSASAGMDQHNHGRAQQGAYAAQQRLALARQLSGKASAPAAGGGAQTDFRHHVAHAAGVGQVSVPEVHAAIDALAQSGHLTPVQAIGLKHHKGHLHGPAGQATVSKIGMAVRARRAAASRPAMPRPMAPQPGPTAPQPGPAMPAIANGGMPAGMGQ